jgi:hypothetical protein
LPVLLCFSTDRLDEHIGGFEGATAHVEFALVVTQYLLDLQPGLTQMLAQTAGVQGRDGASSSVRVH